MEFNEIDRYWSYDNGGILVCDIFVIINNQWYWLIGVVGLMIFFYCILKGSCNIEYLIWINGDYFSELYQLVFRDVCFYSNIDCCINVFNVCI